MAINFLLSKIASYPSRTVLFENFFCVVAVLYLVYNLESWVPYLDIIKGIWGEKLFAAAATPPSCHIQSPKEKRARINFASYLLAMLQKIIFAAGGVAFQYQRKKCNENKHPYLWEIDSNSPKEYIQFMYRICIIILYK